LFTLFVPFADSAFPVLYALMSRKTQALNVKVFQKVLDLVPEFATTCAMADFEEASVAAFQQVFPADSACGMLDSLCSVTHQAHKQDRSEGRVWT